MSLVEGFAHAINSLIAPNEQKTQEYEVFNSRKTSKMSLYLFLDHLQYQLDIPDEIFAVSYAGVTNFMNMCEDFALSIVNAHRLLLVSVVTALKQHSDFIPPLSFICKIGCLSKAEYCRCELIYLKKLNWKLNIHSVEDTMKFLLDQADPAVVKEEDSEGFQDLQTDNDDTCSELSFFFLITN